MSSRASEATRDSTPPRANLPGSADAAPPDDPVEAEVSEAFLPRAPISTRAEAAAFCQTLVQAQLAAAANVAAPPNAAIQGDAAFRSAFLLLLTQEQQRRLFLQVAAQKTAWPRIRPLFGAPPFAFLRPGDGEFLRAGGFARARTNMAYETRTVANSGQFGTGTHADEHGRLFRIAGQGGEAAPLSGPSGFQATANADGLIVVDVRLRKRAPRKKLELLSGVEKKRVLFPLPGEIVQLRETRQFCRLTGTARTATALRVRAVAPRDQRATSARLLVTLA